MTKRAEQIMQLKHKNMVSAQINYLNRLGRLNDLTQKVLYLLQTTKDLSKQKASKIYGFKSDA